MRTGILLCELFSNPPRPFTYGDPHMHTAIPVCKITHMGIQDLISHMEIFPVCIRLVTEISPYAYWDRVNPHMHTGIFVMWSPYANGDLRDPHMHMGIDLDPRMHTGFMCHAIPVHIRGSLLPPYAYGDWSRSPYAYGDSWHIIPI
jgi:hypothetical protein